MAAIRIRGSASGDASPPTCASSTRMPLLPPIGVSSWVRSPAELILTDRPAITKRAQAPGRILPTIGTIGKFNRFALPAGGPYVARSIDTSQPSWQQPFENVSACDFHLAGAKIGFACCNRHTAHDRGQRRGVGFQGCGWRFGRSWQEAMWQYANLFSCLPSTLVTCHASGTPGSWQVTTGRKVHVI